MQVIVYSMLDAEKNTVRLVVVIPALNEAATIENVIRHVPRSIDGIHTIQIVVVDDGSTDATASLAKQCGATVVSHAHNRGVGAAFATGIRHALTIGADVIVNMDGDGQFSPEDIPTLIQPLQHSNVGFVTCTRFKDPELIPRMPLVKKWGNLAMVKIISTITGIDSLTDVSCGFRAYTRDVALRLTLFGDFTYTQETFIDLASKGIAIAEVPLAIRGTREFGKSRVANSIIRYAVRALPIILRGFRDVKPLSFFGTPAALLSLLGIGQLGFVAVWFLQTSQTSPWTSLITSGSTMLISGLLVGTIALLADFLGRNRKLQEESLYYERKRFYDRCALHHMNSHESSMTLGTTIASPSGTHPV